MSQIFFFFEKFKFGQILCNIYNQFEPDSTHVCVSRHYVRDSIKFYKKFICILANTVVICKRQISLSSIFWVAFLLIKICYFSYAIALYTILCKPSQYISKRMWHLLKKLIFWLLRIFDELSTTVHQTFATVKILVF